MFMTDGPHQLLWPRALDTNLNPLGIWYILSETALGFKLATCFVTNARPIPSGHNDGYSIVEGMFLIEGNRHTRDNYIPSLRVKTRPLWRTVGRKFVHKIFPTEVWSESRKCGHNIFTVSSVLIKPGYHLKWALNIVHPIWWSFIPGNWDVPGTFSIWIYLDRSLFDLDWP